MSLCTGAFVLAAAGVLNGRRAATHWSAAAQLAAEFPEIKVDAAVLYVDDGDVLTSAGSAASLDLCLHVVREDFGAEIAARFARDLVVALHREGEQAQFISSPVERIEIPDLFAQSLAWAQTNLERPITIADLAAQAAMSPRTFVRHFAAHLGQTPYDWLLRQRVTAARRLLETTELSIDEISARCGFGSGTNLRKHFRRIVSIPPSAYRRAFHEDKPLALTNTVAT